MWELPPPVGLIPCRCHVTVIVVQHNGRLDVVVQNCGHLREGKVGFRRSRNLRIHCLKTFPAYLLPWTGRSQAAPGHGMPPYPWRDSPQGHINVVCAFGALGGTNLRLGDPPPRPPKICIIMYSLVYTYFIHSCPSRS